MQRDAEAGRTAQNRIGAHRRKKGAFRRKNRYICARHAAHSTEHVAFCGQGACMRFFAGAGQKKAQVESSFLLRRAPRFSGLERVIKFFSLHNISCLLLFQSRLLHCFLLQLQAHFIFCKKENFATTRSTPNCFLLWYWLFLKNTINSNASFETTLLWFAITNDLHLLHFFVVSFSLFFETLTLSVSFEMQQKCSLLSQQSDSLSFFLN